jgi:hypothetical protein
MVRTIRNCQKHDRSNCAWHMALHTCVFRPPCVITPAGCSCGAGLARVLCAYAAFEDEACAYCADYYYECSTCGQELQFSRDALRCPDCSAFICSPCTSASGVYFSHAPVAVCTCDGDVKILCDGCHGFYCKNCQTCRLPEMTDLYIQTYFVACPTCAVSTPELYNCSCSPVGDAVKFQCASCKSHYCTRCNPSCACWFCLD